MISLPDLDQLLTRWESNLSAATTNLLALKKELPYELILGPTASVKLVGISQTTAAPVMEDMLEVWQHISLIMDVVARARTLRDSEKRPSGKTIEAVYDLLTTASITLPAVTVPLQQRGLLTHASTTDKATPQELLDAMSTTFGKAKDIVFQIEKIWQDLQPKLDSLKAQAVSLRQLASELGQPPCTELDQFEQKLDTLRQSIFSDPLAAGNQTDTQFEPLVEAARKRLEPLKKQRDEIVQAIAQAKAGLPALETLHKECETNHGEALDAIDQAPSLPRSNYTLERLSEWLTRIETAAAKSPANAVSLFANWSKAADEYRQLETAANNGYQELLAERQELKSRLRAYKTTAGKQQYKGANMVEDPTLAQLAAAGELSLSRPAKLVEARQAVNDYHSRLRKLEQENSEGAATPAAPQS